MTPVMSQDPVPGIGSHGWHPLGTCGEYPAAYTPMFPEVPAEPGTGSLSAYVKFCEGARHPASAALNCPKFDAWFIPRRADRSSDGTFPIQSTAIVWPAWVMT